MASWNLLNWLERIWIFTVKNFTENCLYILVNTLLGFLYLTGDMFQMYGPVSQRIWLCVLGNDISSSWIIFQHFCAFTKKTKKTVVFRCKNLSGKQLHVLPDNYFLTAFGH